MSEVSKRSIRNMNARTNDDYRDNWDKIFKPKKKTLCQKVMTSIQKKR